MPRPVEHENRRELLKLRLAPVNSLKRQAWQSGDRSAYQHYCDCWWREFEAYINGLGPYASGI